MPKRIQLSRRKGWRLPEGAVNVARPSRWGNPFGFAKGHATEAVELYRRWMTSVGHFEATLNGDVFLNRIPEYWEPQDLRSDLHMIRGKDLACWCPIGSPCHADVLLELANEKPAADGEGG